MDGKETTDKAPEPLSGSALNDYYKDCSAALTQSLIDAVSASRETEGLPSGDGARRFWASVLFARICGFGFAMHRLLPGTPANVQGTIYDFGSVGTICRSLFEAYVTFIYLCDASLEVDEYSLRLLGMQLHDCTRRPNILSKITGDEPDSRFVEQAAALKEGIKKNPAFAAKEPRQQQKLLKGESAFYLSQDEIVAGNRDESSQNRGVYEFLSSQTHSFPFSFIRAHLHTDRGTGRENDVDKKYLAIAAEIAAPILQDATGHMARLFPEVGEFRRYSVNWDTAVCTRVPEDGFNIKM